MLLSVGWYGGDDDDDDDASSDGDDGNARVNGKNLDCYYEEKAHCRSEIREK
jgi:hypothetical protein